MPSRVPLRRPRRLGRPLNTLPLQPRRSEYRAAVLALSPISYWRLGETGTTVARDEIGPNPGTYTGTYTLGISGALTGDQDSAVAFAGAGEVDVLDNDTLDTANGPISIVAWVQRNASQNATQGIVSKGTGAWYLRFDASNKLNFLRSQEADLAASSGTITDTASWHMVAVTYAGSNGAITFYIDGIASGSTSPTTNLISNALQARLGNEISGVEPSQGSLDEIAVFGAALTGPQLVTLWQTGHIPGPVSASWSSAITSSDAWVRSAGFARTLTEAVSSSDVWSRTGTFARTLTGTVTSADIWTRTATFNRTLTEAVTSSDAWTRSIVFLRTLTEAVTSADVWTRSAGFARAITQTVTTSDVWTRTGTFARTLTEAVTSSDVWTRSGGFIRSWTEAVTTSDAWTGIKIILRSWAEAVSSSDAWTRTGSFGRTLTATVTSSDAWTRTGTFARTLTEAVATADAWTRSAGFARTLTEALTQTVGFVATASSGIIGGIGRAFAYAIHAVPSAIASHRTGAGSASNATPSGTASHPTPSGTADHEVPE